MSKRIKVTGYLYPDDMDPEHVDLSHETGLSTEGFDVLHALLARAALDDVSMEVVDDDE